MKAEDHLGLIPFVISKYFPYAMTKQDLFDDYFQEGCIGLIIACNRYDERKGTFTTYAVSHIWGEIMNYKTRFEYSPLYVSRKIKMRSQKIHKLEGQGYNDSEICNLLEITEDELNEIKRFSPFTQSLQSMIYNNNTDSSQIYLQEMLPSNIDVEDEVIKRNMLKEAFVEVKQKTNERDYQIFILSLRGFTQREIGKKLKVSQPQISRILSRIKKITSEIQEKVEVL